jgi:(1->4)-alpha-D-glucan 1-alpha-D-glucosylmutase
MKVPLATYRIQFGPHFGFRQARELVGYLHELGISHLYASPVFKARKGSTHGYDVVDPNQLNPELGTRAEFEALMRDLKDRRMGWLQDIVPNHMAYDGANPWLADLFENGSASKYRRFFDIDWKHDHSELKGKVLAPFLGRSRAQCLEDKEIRLVYGAEGLCLAYYDRVWPLKAETYALILSLVRERLAVHRDRRGAAAGRLAAIASVFEELPRFPNIKQRQRQVREAKADLWRLCRQRPQIRQAMDDTLLGLNENLQDPQTQSVRQALQTQQVYLLSFWKRAACQINYRRFFAINELIGLRQERAEVFNQTHALILRLVQQGWFSGLRLDHIDGLADPAAYLERLRQKAPAAYLIVEKILSPGEQLPAGWPVQGTTGYDFSNALFGLFCRQTHAERFAELYRYWSGRTSDYEAIVYRSKAQFLTQEMAGDLHNLTRLLQRAAAGQGQKWPLERLGPALTAFLAAFAVYRTYIGRTGPTPQERRYVRQAARTAVSREPTLKQEIEWIRTLLLQPAEDRRERSKQSPADLRLAVQRLQQLAPAAAAKGVEDTALYRFHRLVSLNDVGGEPGSFGCSRDHFHTFMRRRRRHWPHSMNSSSTHDAKRSEDVRARINVLSERPEQWQELAQSWHRLNQVHCVELNGRRVPDGHMAYFIYQTLAGACPLDPNRLPGFAERVADYLVKAAREAKEQTAWIDPDPAYENALTTFVHRILTPGPQNPFWRRFEPFLREIVHYGALSAWSQTLIKITAPGVPDFYQGMELPVFSLVDPDNRRPVDFGVRQQWLKQIRQQHAADPLALIGDLLSDRSSGRTKLFLTYAALQARRQHAALYQKGNYQALTVTGRFQDHVVAFARHYAKCWSLTLVPRFISGLVPPGADPLGSAVWGDTACQLPPHAPAQWTDALTGQPVETRGWLPVGQALRHFPAALLIGGISP